MAGVFHTLEELGLGAALDSLEHLASATVSCSAPATSSLTRWVARPSRHAGNSDTVIAHCRPDFGSGCYHGVVEASLHHDHRVAMDELEHMCGAAEAEAHPGSLFECVHGVGHGVLGRGRWGCFPRPALLRRAELGCAPWFLPRGRLHGGHHGRGGRARPSYARQPSCGHWRRSGPRPGRSRTAPAEDTKARTVRPAGSSRGTSFSGPWSSTPVRLSRFATRRRRPGLAAAIKVWGTSSPASFNATPGGSSIVAARVGRSSAPSARPGPS